MKGAGAVPVIRASVCGETDGEGTTGSILPVRAGPREPVGPVRRAARARGPVPARRTPV
ncbi:hypothetical protein GCM10010524_68130 [Streptomyces mexicanus]